MVEDPIPEVPEGYVDPTIGSSYLKYLAIKYSLENVIGNLEMAPTQQLYGDWNQSKPLIDFEECSKPKNREKLVSVNFLSVYENIPTEIAQQLQELLLPEVTEPDESLINLHLERDIIIPPKTTRK